MAQVTATGFSDPPLDSRRRHFVGPEGEARSPSAAARPSSQTRIIRTFDASRTSYWLWDADEGEDFDENDDFDGSGFDDDGLDDEIGDEVLGKVSAPKN